MFCLSRSSTNCSTIRSQKASQKAVVGSASDGRQSHNPPFLMNLVKRRLPSSFVTGAQLTVACWQQRYTPVTHPEAECSGSCLEVSVLSVADLDVRFCSSR